MTLVFSSLIFQCVLREPQRMRFGILTSIQDYNLQTPSSSRKTVNAVYIDIQYASMIKTSSLYSHSYILNSQTFIMDPHPYFCHVKAIYPLE